MDRTEFTKEHHLNLCQCLSPTQKTIQKIKDFIGNQPITLNGKS